MLVFELEVVGAKYPVYVTELGCVTLKDGERVLVIPAAAKSMLLGYGGALRKVGEHEKATLQNTTWERVGGGTIPPAAAPVEAVAQNASMAGKPKRAKGKV